MLSPPKSPIRAVALRGAAAPIVGGTGAAAAPAPCVQSDEKNRRWNGVTSHAFRLPSTSTAPSWPHTAALALPPGCSCPRGPAPAVPIPFALLQPLLSPAHQQLPVHLPVPLSVHPSARMCNIALIVHSRLFTPQSAEKGEIFTVAPGEILNPAEAMGSDTRSLPVTFPFHHDPSSLGLNHIPACCRLPASQAPSPGKRRSWELGEEGVKGRSRSRVCCKFGAARMLLRCRGAH